MVAQKMTLIPRRQAMRLLTGVAASSLFPFKVLLLLIKLPVAFLK